MVRIRLPPAESHSARWNSHALHPLDGKDSPNTGWRNEAFRGFADYLQTEEFRDAPAALIRLSLEKRMCAEAVPWRCHRSWWATRSVCAAFRSSRSCPRAAGGCIS